MDNQDPFDFSDDPRVTGTPSHSAVSGILLAGLATAFVISVYGKIFQINQALPEPSQTSKSAVPVKPVDAPKAKPQPCA